MLADLLIMPFRHLTHRPVVTRAFDIACEYDLRWYDTLYLSLPEGDGAVVLTADDRPAKVADRLGLRIFGP